MNESITPTTDLEGDILKKLIKAELSDPEQGLPEHIPQQIESLRQNLGITNLETLKSLVVLGLSIDVEIQNKTTGRAELALFTYEDLASIIKKLYANEFPDVSDLLVQQVVGRSIDGIDLNQDKYFIDALIAEINQARAALHNDHTIHTYYVEENGVVYTNGNPRLESSQPDKN